MSIPPRGDNPGKSEHSLAGIREAIKKAFHGEPVMTPDPRYMRRLVKEMIGDNVSDKQRRAITGFAAVKTDEGAEPVRVKIK